MWTTLFKGLFTKSQSLQTIFYKLLKYFHEVHKYIKIACFTKTKSIMSISPWYSFRNFFSSVAQLYPTVCNPMDCSMPDFPVHHQLPELAQTHVHWVSNAIQLSVGCRSLLLPSIFPSIRAFSTESVLHIRWSKYLSSSFSISPSNEYSGLISFRID